MTKIIITVRRFAYAVFGLMHGIVRFRRPDVVVYCYHSVDTDDWRFSVSLDRLKQQVEALLTEADPLTIMEAEQYLAGTLRLKRPGFLITFDDGYRDILTTVEFFRAKGIRPVVFALSNPESANRMEVENEKPFLSVQELRMLRENGWTIGCHSATHACFQKLDVAGMEREIVAAKRELETALGTPIPYFAYPKGEYTDAAVKIVRQAGFTLGFTVEHGVMTSRSEKLLLPRVGVDRTHTLSEFLVMSTEKGIRFKEHVAQYIGRFL